MRSESARRGEAHRLTCLRHRDIAMTFPSAAASRVFCHSAICRIRFGQARGGGAGQAPRIGAAPSRSLRAYDLTTLRLRPETRPPKKLPRFGVIPCSTIHIGSRCVNAFQWFCDGLTRKAASCQALRLAVSRALWAECCRIGRSAARFG